MSGCGVQDGSEIHEAVSAMIGVSMTGAQYKCFAPNIPYRHVINHAKGEVAQGESRNVLVESARISRGDITDLSQLDSTKFDALIIPGGYGAAKNLCDFAEKQADFTINPDLVKVMKDFHSEKKPIGLCCISPVIAAKVFPGSSVTIGSDEGTAKAITALSSKNVPKKVDEVHIDKVNLLITTPAYMAPDPPIHKVYEGVVKMVKNVLQLTKEEEF
uniref:DJ-1/PfpI domain-containing protein n=1 Tax=Arcella intermedia TaxID=1963864 RepID=A0A6B2LG34_9EUKA